MSAEEQTCVDISPLIFRQLFDRETCTFTYILGCQATKEAIIIDPVIGLVERDAKLIKELGLKLKYGMNTHVHADHITGTGKLKEIFAGCKSIVSKRSGAKADEFVDQGDQVMFGNQTLECRCTPGHTDGCMTYVCHDHKMAFTGDALLIRGCGRTDFQQGDSGRLFDSVHSQILSLPGGYKLYVAHDYKGCTITTVAEEKQFNPRLTQTKEKFMEIMANLNLSAPKYIDKAVPANMMCGYVAE